MSDLTDFLLARIAEDREVAEAFPQGKGNLPPANLKQSFYPPDEKRVVMGTGPDMTLETPEQAAFLARFDPARVIADCNARRATVHLLGLDANEPSELDHAADDLGSAAVGVLQLMALPYSDHIDYQRRWRP